MLALYASLTKLFRACEQTMKVASHKAGNSARTKAADILKRMNETADQMRKSATDLEKRAQTNLSDELHRIESKLAGL